MYCKCTTTNKSIDRLFYKSLERSEEEYHNTYKKMWHHDESVPGECC